MFGNDLKISKVKQLVLKQFRIISYICKSVQRHLDICLGFSGRKSPILPTLGRRTREKLNFFRSNCCVMNKE